MTDLLAPDSVTRIPVTSGQLDLGDFRTEAGEVLPKASLAWRAFGDPSRGRDAGWTLVFHALTGSADVPAWWGPLLAPGGALDPATRPVLAANLLGSCYGSTGPVDCSPASFPLLTARDLARAHLPLLTELGVERLARVTGGSLGGMVALHFGTLSPVAIERLVVFAAPAATGAQAIAWNAAQRLAIEADPVRGLAAARAIAMITYRSAIEFEHRFARRATRSPGRFDVEHYLRRQGDKLVARFDAASYLALMDAMDTHDVGPPALAALATAERCEEVVGVGVDTDILYAASEVRDWVEAYRAAGAHARYEEIHSPFGHDAFLIEFEEVGRILR